MRRHLLAFLVGWTFCLSVLAAGGFHEAGRVSGQADWPKGLADLVNDPSRVGGYFVNSDDRFFFSGDVACFNRMLRQYAALEPSPVLRLHAGKGSETPFGGREGSIAFDWSLSIDDLILRRAAGRETGVTGGKGAAYRVSMDLWVGGGVDLFCVELPANVPVEAAEPGASKEQEAPKPATPQEEIEALGKRLGDPSFRVRAEAEAALVQLGDVATDVLRKATASQDPEVALRATRALDRIRTGATAGAQRKRIDAFLGKHGAGEGR